MDLGRCPFLADTADSFSKVNGRRAWVEAAGRDDFGSTSNALEREEREYRSPTITASFKQLRACSILGYLDLALGGRVLATLCAARVPYISVYYKHSYVCSILGYLDFALGGRVLAMFCAATATTHLLSATTHVWPDNHLLVRVCQFDRRACQRVVDPCR
jgi:hypothetical protein